MYFSKAETKVYGHLSLLTLGYPEHSTMSSPPFMLTLKVFSDFSRALQKARRQRLNPSEIQEHYVSFWSSSDAKDNIWVDLRPLEGWGTSEWGDRNYIITWEVHCFVKML